MPKIKTHQSIAKRYRVTKKGKLMKKKAGQDHFNARESSNITRAKRRNTTTSKTITKQLKSLMPYN
jgi:large subunit ribosomal protein L35